MKKIEYMLLTSAMGLGTYVPALHIRDGLEEKGFSVKLCLYEDYFSDETMSEYKRSKDAYHKDMRVAVAAHKMASKRLKSALKSETLERILDEWQKDEVRKFVLLSGNWITLVRRYKEERCQEIEAYIVHMDIGVAPSFKHFQNEDALFSEIYPIDSDGVHALIDNHFEEKAATEREDNKIRLYVHGGGWGMGNYQSIADKLMLRDDIDLLLASYGTDEMKEGVTYSLLDAEWEPWKLDDNGRHQYPKMRTNLNNNQMVCIDNSYSNGLYSLYSQCDALISKPGGATLMDSLIVGVPMIFITPIAEHEKVNAEAGVKLGLGISYEDWKESGFDVNILKKLKDNIQEIRRSKVGVTECILKGTASANGGG